MHPKYNDKRSNITFLVFLYLAVFGFLMIMIGHPYENNRLISMGTWSIILSSALGTVFFFLGKAIKDMKGLFLLLLMFVSTLMSLVYAGNFGYSAFVALLCYMEIPMFVFFINEGKIQKIKKYIYYLFYFLSCFFIYLSTTDIAHDFKTYYGIAKLSALTLGYNNPNETGIYLFVCFVIILSGLFYFKKKVIRFLFIVNAVWLFVLIYQTESRACILISAITVFSLLILKKINRVKNVAIIISLIPVLWAIIVLLFNDSISKLTFLGESVETGRLSMYMRPFEDINIFSALWGSFSEYIFTNLHNSYISIFATTGIIGIMLFFAFIQTKIISLSAHFEFFDFSERIAFVGIMLVILHSSAEAAMLVSGSAYAVGFVALYILAFSRSFDRGEQDDGITY